MKGAGRQVEKTIRDIKEAQAGREETLKARSELQGFLAAIEKKKEEDAAKPGADYLERKLRQVRSRGGRKGGEQAPEKPSAPLQIGEKVRVRDSGMVGEIVRLSGKNVTVTVGNISATVPSGRVERISSNEFKQAARAISKPVYEKVDSSIRERKLRFSPELDLRGERLQDALDAVMHYIDDALMLGMGSVRIIHGKGTGVLRDEIQKYLRTVPGVASATDEDIRHGGSGVTVVTLQ